MAEQVAAASSLPSLWAPVLNGAIGIVAANHGAYKQYKYNSRLQKEAAKLNYKYAEKQVRNSPTWNRAGLEGAGYNPMLAVQNATSGANSNWTSNSSVSAPDYSGLGVADTINNAARLQEVKNQTEQTESTKEINHANALKSITEGITNALKFQWIDKREKAEIENTVKDTAKKQAEINKVDADISYMEKSLELEAKMQEIIKRGQDIGFAGAKYAADKGYSASVYNANTYKDTVDAHSPSGKSESFKNYAGGIGSILGGAGSILSPFKGLFDSPFDIDEHTYTYDRHGNRSGERHTQRNYNRR